MRIIKSALFLLVLTMSVVAWAGPVNINTADAAALVTSIKGVGEKKAQAIVAYRTQNGPFKSVEGLSKVKGIGPVIIEKNRDNLTVEDGSQAVKAVDNKSK